MRASVKNQFRTFNAPLEGVVKYMYLDIKGLVTIGVGNLIDPINAAWHCCINRASPHIWGYEQAKTKVSHSELAGVQRRVGRTWIVDGVV